MFNVLQLPFVLSIDSALASAAIGLRMPSTRTQWRIPALFALCDGMAALVSAELHLWRRATAVAIEERTVVVCGCAWLALLLLSSIPSAGKPEKSTLRSAFALIGIPVSADLL